MWPNVPWDTMTWAIPLGVLLVMVFLIPDVARGLAGRGHLRAARATARVDRLVAHARPEARLDAEGLQPRAVHDGRRRRESSSASSRCRWPSRSPSRAASRRAAGCGPPSLPGFIISALGGSRVQIGGPTGAFVVIVYGIVQKYGIDGLTVATLMAGVLLVIMGLAKLGTAIKFIPHPVITGFTSGIAVIIFSSQIKDLFGLEDGCGAGGVSRQVGGVRGARGGVHAGRDRRCRGLAGDHHAVAEASSQRIPGPFVALIVTTVAVELMHLPVETIGTRFGELNAAIAASAAAASVARRSSPRSSARHSRSRCSPRSNRCSRPSSPTA